MQVPTPVMVTVPANSEQDPAAVRVTGRPDDAVALTAKGASPYVLSAREANVIV